MLPGHAFELTARLTTHPALGGGAISGVSIRIGLHSLPASEEGGSDDDDGYTAASTRAARYTHGDTLLSNVPASAMPAPARGASLLALPCTLTSSPTGEVSSKGRCQLALPGVGRYLAVACTHSSATNAAEVCTAIVLGRTAREWRNAPLTEYLPLAVAPTADRALYAIGESPVILLTYLLTCLLACLLTCLLAYLGTPLASLPSSS